MNAWPNNEDVNDLPIVSSRELMLGDMSAGMAVVQLPNGYYCTLIGSDFLRDTIPYGSIFPPALTMTHSQGTAEALGGPLVDLLRGWLDRRDIATIAEDLHITWRIDAQLTMSGIDPKTLTTIEELTVHKIQIDDEWSDKLNPGSVSEDRIRDATKYSIVLFQQIDRCKIIAHKLVNG